MTETLVYVDHSRIRTGKEEELQAAMVELAHFVEEHEPQLVAFNVYFDQESRKMTVMHVHDGPDSLDYHFQVAGPRFSRFADLIDLDRIEVYGRASQSALRKMREKAESLGSGSVEVHRFQAGFVRTEGVGAIG